MSFDKATLASAAASETPDQSLNGSRSAFEYRRFKEIHQLGLTELRRRLASLGVGAVLLTLIFDTGFPVVWFAAYAPLLGLYCFTIPRQPDWVSRRRFGALIAFDMLTFATFSVLGLYLWIMGGAVPMILSLLLMSGAYLYTMSARTRERVLFKADLAVCTLEVAVRLGWMWIVAPGEDMTVILSVALVLFYLYYVQVSFNIRRLHVAFQATQKVRIQNERLQAVGQMSGGIAHDFNNMLTAVLGNIELARLTPESSEKNELLDEAEKSARRGAELTAQLLAYSGKAPLRPRRCAPAELLTGMRTVIRDRLAGGQRLKLDCEADDLPDLKIDPAQLQTVLTCLADNAADAMGAGGILTMSCRTNDLFGAPGVTISVSDTGKGIPSDVLPLVFEPYFTTKPKGQGTGLGLAMVRGIVEQSGGRIGINSDESRGTEVLLHFPPATP